MKYLGCTYGWGIVYHHSHPVESLPEGSFEFLKLEEGLPVVPVRKSKDLIYQANAAYVTDRVKHCSVSGIIGCYNYVAALYKLHLQLAHTLWYGVLVV